MHKYHFLILLFLSFGAMHTANGQASDSIRTTLPLFVCGYDMVMQQSKIATPYFQERLDQWEKERLNRANDTVLIMSLAPPYTLPVVVHIIHNNGAENISDAQVTAAIAHLNQGFTQQDFYNSGNGFNTNIEFCLAQQDPDGNFTTGINRVQSSLTDVNYSTQNLEMKNLSRWDPLRYINIWIVKRICTDDAGCNIAGYATFPTSHGDDLDGIVVEAAYIGTQNNPSVVTIHEMGHYLGLYHTFEGGCNNDDCLTNGDRVCDTPPDQTVSPTSCSSPTNSCTTDVNLADTNNPFTSDQNDPTNNFMDYSNCSVTFTGGQANRMYDALENTRFTLLNSTVCSPACTVNIEASFTASATTVFLGETVSFNNTSTNADNFLWTVDGVPFAGDNFIFENLGIQIVNLTVGNNEPDCVSDFSMAITVLCEAEASFDFSASSVGVGESINFTNTSTGGNNYEWSVNQSAPTTTTDFSFSSSTEGLYEICLAISNGICETKKCQVVLVQTAGNGNENCVNGIDDDGDGLVDFFDPDCPCLNPDGCGTPYFSNCETNCEDNFPTEPFSMNSELTDTPVSLLTNIMTVGDVDGDCQPDMITVAGINSTLSLTVIDGMTKATKYIASDVISPGHICSGDVDNDGRAEIFISSKIVGSTDFYIMRYDFNLTTNALERTWVTAVPIETLPGDNFIRSVFPFLADFNQDGRPEVYVGNQIFDSKTGIELVKMGNDFNRGGARRLNTNTGNWDVTGTMNSAIAVDLLADQYCPTCDGLEMAAGNQVFTIDIQSYTDPSLNSMSLVVERPDMRDGVTAIADFDMDGDLDIIVADFNATISSLFTNTTVRLYVWDGQTDAYVCEPFVYETNPTAKITVPTIGDIDGDGRPEIIINDGQISVFEDYEAGGGTNWGSIPNNTRVANINSGDHALGIILFDFELDGKAEIVLRNSQGLSIYDAELNVKGYEPILALTADESPLVADIDNDGEAEIITWGAAPGVSTFTQHYLYIVKSNSFAWPNTRKIWNQFSHFNVNINEDGTIPIEQQNHILAGDGALNNFNQQYAIPEPADTIVDIAVEILQLNCTTAGIELDFEICNNGQTWSLPTSFPISIYEGNPTSVNAMLLLTVELNTILAPGDCLLFSEIINGQGDIYIVANDDGNLSRPYNIESSLPTSNLAECDYLDNIAGAPIVYSTPLPLDLGPDILICDNGVFELKTSNAFTSYLWFDGSIESTNTIFSEGIYWVEATDACGIVQRDSITIEVDPISIVDLGEDLILCNLETITLDAGNFDSYIWSADFGTGCIDCPTLSFQVAQDTQVIVTVGSDLGCFSTDTINIFLENVPMTFETVSICEGDTVFVGGESFFADTVLVQSFTTLLNCDSIHNTTITILENVFSNETVIACEGDTVIVFGNTVVANQVLLESFIAPNSCDSTHTVTVTFIESIFTEENIQLCEGDSTIVFGNTIFENEILSQTFISSTGCDSTHQVTVGFNDFIFTSDTFELCKGDTVFVFGNMVLDDTILSETNLSFSGCDSTHTVSVMFFETIFTSETFELCEGDTAFVFGNIVLGDTTLNETNISFTGCDSTHTISVTFIESVFTEENIQLCEGDSVLVFGNIIFENEILSQTFVSSTGCDSTHQVTVAFDELVFTSETLALCEGDTAFVFGSIVLKDTTLSETNISFNGCDSTHTISVTFVESIFTEEIIQLCEGDSVFVFGDTIFENEILSQSFTSSAGCDSTHQVTVEFDDLIFTSDTLQLCEGDTTFVFGNMITQDEVLSQNFVAFNNCDSVHEVVVTFWEEIEIYTSENICEGDSVAFFSQNITTAGTFMETISPLSSNCETTYILNVEIQPEIIFSLPDTISSIGGQSVGLPLAITSPNIEVTWSPSDGLSCSSCNNPFATISESQNYTVTLTNAAGCTEVAELFVAISETENVFIPNAFSPNEDGVNDFFTVYTNEKIVEIEKMWIYDRWGGLMYQNQNLPPNISSIGWDGTSNGKPVSLGVYIYQIWLRSDDGTVNLFSGDVSIVK